jgi:hypothetical protein
MQLARTFAWIALLCLLGCPGDDDQAADAGRDGGGPEAGEPPGMCVPKGGNCSGGRSCCADLACCRGGGIPVGQEFCELQCPVND